MEREHSHEIECGSECPLSGLAKVTLNLRQPEIALDVSHVTTCKSVKHKLDSNRTQGVVGNIQLQRRHD